jgi:hypothetical protein
MNRKMKAIAVVVVITVAITGVVLVVNPFGTQFHYERAWHSGDARWGSVRFYDLKDCNVTISFVNDSSVHHRLDVELYTPTFASSAFTIISSIKVGLKFTAISRIRSLNLVLGTGTQYYISFSLSARLNTTIVYGNGALMGDDARFLYSASGILRFAFTENVNFTEKGMECSMNVFPSGTAYVYVDLPDGMDGRASLGGDNVYTTELSGWYYRLGNTYSTAITVQEPLLDLTAHGTTVYARLYD